MINSMKEIHEEFKKDCCIDQTNFIKEYIRFTELHSKYLKLYSDTKRALIGANRDMKKLRLEKHKLYMHGMTKEEWKQKMVPPERVMKGDLPLYIEADPDVVHLQTHIELLQDQVDVLDKMAKSIQYMNRVIDEIRKERDYREGN